MSTSVLVEIKSFLDRYPPYIVRVPETVSIDETMIDSELKADLHVSFRKYLTVLQDLIKRRDYYSHNNRTSLRDWLSKILDLLNAFQEMMVLCGEVSDPFISERNWARSLALKGMTNIIDNMKQKIQMLRGQIEYRSELIARTREKAFMVLASDFLGLLDILITLIAIESEVLSASEIVHVVGKGSTGFQARILT